MFDILLFAALLLINLQSSKETNVTNHNSEDRYASYSPDGKQILFESNRSGNWDLYLMNADGSFIRQITRDSADDRRPSWHPSGNSILFESNRLGKFQLFTLELKNGRTEELAIPNSKGEPIFATYSPDAQFIAYAQKIDDTSSKLVIVESSGKLKKELMNSGFRSFYPRWSPEGLRLLFFSRHETNNDDDELYVINVDGTNKTRLTNRPKHNFCPSWSPDGSQIAYSQSMDGSRPEIFVMDADGSNVKRVTHNEEGDTLPNWSPDGKKLLLTAHRGDNYEIVEVVLPE